MTTRTSDLLHQSAVIAAQDYRKAEAQLVEALIRIEAELVYAHLGHSSLYDYAVRALGLSEGLAYSAITVARKSITGSPSAKADPIAQTI